MQHGSLEWKARHWPFANTLWRKTTWRALSSVERLALVEIMKWRRLQNEDAALESQVEWVVFGMVARVARENLPAEYK